MSHTSKTSSLGQPEDGTAHVWRLSPGRSVGRLATLAIMSAFLAGGALLMSHYTATHQSGPELRPLDVTPNNVEKGDRHGGPVSLELFVMSKCPDAVFCENFFASEVLPQVSGIVSLKTRYIASASPTSPIGAICLHGPSECEGNVQQLCVQKYFPDPDIWFKFILCQNRQFRSIPSQTLA
ncbi:hypothetical protein BJ742DRAFT_120400 [Cladochytrium replicatum]|nr:hypothetical protein BJ742DRAFT_120400 [Cladochytrium replicatum]